MTRQTVTFRFMNGLAGMFPGPYHCYGTQASRLLALHHTLATGMSFRDWYKLCLLYVSALDAVGAVPIDCSLIPRFEVFKHRVRLLYVMAEIENVF